MINKLFFIIGLRRSGTSILRTMIDKHPEVAGIEFEPHDLWAAVDLNHFERLKKQHNVGIFIYDTFNRLESHNIHKSGQWYGAKFALNPGVKALEWRWLYKTFPAARFVFINRNLKSVWKSYVKQDKNSFRGIIPCQAYMDMATDLTFNFAEYTQVNADMATMVDYDKLLVDPDFELTKVWKLLNIHNITGFKQFIKQPEF